MAIHGPNALPVAAGRPGWQRFLAHFDDVLIYILLAAAVLKALMGDWVEFAVIFTACFAIALTGFIQEGRAERALSSIEAMLALEAIVFRDGAWVTVGSENLVPVILFGSDRVIGFRLICGLSPQQIFRWMKLH